MLFSIYLIALSILLWLVFLSPAHGLTAVMLMFAVDQVGQSSSPFLAQQQALSNYAIASLSMLAFVIQLKRHGWQTLHVGNSLLLVVLLLSLAMISTLWTLDFDFAINSWIQTTPYLIVYLLLSPHLIASAKDLNIALSGFLLVGAILVIAILFLSEWGHRGLVIAGQLDQYRNVATSNPLAIAQFAAYIALTAIGFGIFDRSFLRRIFYGVLIVLSVVVIVKSGSRGQLLALPVAALLAILLSHSAHRSLISLAIVAIPALIAIFTFQEIIAPDDDIVSRWQGAKFSQGIGIRGYYATSVIDYWLSADWWSLLVGIGSAATQHPKVLGNYPHLVALEVLVEYGVIGLLIFTAIILSTYRNIVEAIRVESRNLRERASLWVLCSLFTFAVIISFKQGNLLTSIDIFLFAILIDKALWLSRTSMPKTWPKH